MPAQTDADALRATLRRLLEFARVPSFMSASMLAGAEELIRVDPAGARARAVEFAALTIEAFGISADELAAAQAARRAG